MTVRMQADQGVFYWVPNEESGSGKAPAKKTRAHVQTGYEETSTETRSSRRTRYADLQFDEVQKPARRAPPRKKSTPKTKVHVLEDGSAAKERVIVIDKRTSKESPMIESRSRSYDDRGYYSDRDSGRYRDRDYDDRPAPRRSAPRYDDRYDDRPRYDDVETRTSSRRTTRQVLIEMAEENGPDTYTYKGTDWVVRRIDGDWDVQRSENVREDDAPVRKGSKSAPKRGSDVDAPKDTVWRKAARWLGLGALAAGVAYALGGIGGIVTHGASVPIYAPAGLPSNVEQAIPALVGGGVFAALGLGARSWGKATKGK